MRERRPDSIDIRRQAISLGQRISGGDKQSRVRSDADSISVLQGEDAERTSAKQKKNESPHLGPVAPVPGQVDQSATTLSGFGFEFGPTLVESVYLRLSFLNFPICLLEPFRIGNNRRVV